jgi:hypothetical protein
MMRFVNSPSSGGMGPERLLLSRPRRVRLVRLPEL